MNELANTSTAPVGARQVNLAAGEMRSELSMQWFARPHDQRFLNLDDLRRKVSARRTASHEQRVRTDQVEFISPTPMEKADLHRLTVGLPDGLEAAPTHWSFGQLAGLAKAPAGYLRTLPSQIVEQNLHYGLRHNRQIEQIKTYEHDGSLLAATGPDYGRIFDVEVVEAVQQIAGSGTGDERWKVPGVMDWGTGVYDPNAPVTIDSTTLYASDRDCFMFLVDDRHPIEVGKLPNGEPDYIFRGFYVGNSEVGAAALKLAAFYLRAICCNRLMWGVEHFEELSIRHSKYAPDRFIEIARPALASFASGSEQRLLQGVEQAKAAKVAANDDDAIEWLARRNLTKKRIDAVLETVEREEGHKARTVWDFAQGITAVARHIPNQDERLNLEREAGRMLDKVAA